MFLTYSIPLNHPLHRLPPRTQALVHAFARPQLPTHLRQHIARVYDNGTALAQWVVEKICTDLATQSHTEADSPIVYWKSPFAKVAPYIYREWTTDSNVELCPYLLYRPSLITTVVRGKEYADALVAWLMTRFALPRIWDTIIQTMEDEDTVGCFGVVHKCQLIRRKGDIVLQLQLDT